jgi:hypothetical protein
LLTIGVLASTLFFLFSATVFCPHK